MQARKISRFALRMLILDLEKHVKEVIDTDDADLIAEAAGALNDLLIVHRQLAGQTASAALS